MIYFYIIPSLRATYYKNKEENVKQTVEVAYNLLVEYQNKCANGEISKSEAQRTALSLIKSLRYNTNDYFWINDLEPKMILHPLNQN